MPMVSATGGHFTGDGDRAPIQRPVRPQDGSARRPARPASSTSTSSPTRIVHAGGVGDEVDAEPGRAVPPPDPRERGDRLLLAHGGVGVDRRDHAAGAALDRPEDRVADRGSGASRPRPTASAAGDHDVGAEAGHRQRRVGALGALDDHVVQGRERRLGRDEQRVTVGEGDPVVGLAERRARRPRGSGRRGRRGAPVRPSALLNHASASAPAGAAVQLRAPERRPASGHAGSGVRHVELRGGRARSAAARRR